MDYEQTKKCSQRKFSRSGLVSEHVLNRATCLELTQTYCTCNSGKSDFSSPTMTFFSLSIQRQNWDRADLSPQHRQCSQTHCKWSESKAGNCLLFSKINNSDKLLRQNQMVTWIQRDRLIWGAGNDCLTVLVWSGCLICSPRTVCITNP